MADKELKNLTDEVIVAWGDVVEPRRDPQPKALIAGVNFRVNVMKAFKAVYLSVKFYIETKKMLVTGIMNPVEVLKIPWDVYDIIIATLDALREKMAVLDYTACVVLSNSPNGFEEKDFKEAIEKFVQIENVDDLPLYLGFSSKRILESRKAMTSSTWFDDLLKRLDHDDWLERNGSRIKFEPRHYTWGLKID